MNPNEFLTAYPVCPKCGARFIENPMIFSGLIAGPCAVYECYIREHDIKISIEHPLSGVPLGPKCRVEFSIDYSDGSICLHNGTKWDSFDSSEIATVSLDFSCENCSMFGNCGFFYGCCAKSLGNRQFGFRPDLIYFQYAVNETLYLLTSDFSSGKTILEIKELNTGENSKIELPLIDIRIFDFTSKNRIQEKFNTIMLLA